jgi:hypothetical protein
MSYRADISHNIEILNLRMEKLEEQMEMLKRIVAYMEKTLDQYVNAPSSSSSSGSEVDYDIKPLTIAQVIKEEIIPVESPKKKKQLIGRRAA